MRRMKFRRRREGKTNYLKRRDMLKSDSPRIVFRRTNRYIIAQYVTSHEAKDKIEIGVTSKNLMKYGWPKESGNLKSITASYLTGMLIGKKIQKEKKKMPILDLGIISPVHKTRAYAFLKGLIDSGLEMKIKKDEAFPEEDRISGKHMKKDFSKTFEEIKSKIEKE